MNDKDLVFRGEVLAKAHHHPVDGGLIISAYDVENIHAVPHEMSARELLHTERRMFGKYLDAWSEYSDYVLEGKEEEAVQFAEKWAKEHPEQKRKTYAEDFKEKFQKAYETNGHPAGCREAIYYGNGCPHKYVSCEVCWNEVMEDEDG